MAKLTLDLHPIARDGAAIEAELNRVMDEAEAKRIKTVEIIHGKGSGQLKKRVLKFLERKDIKARYARVDKDSKNHGRLFVHFPF
jgi:dsDNA-specific endonuclease/ATPase MutS2